MLRKMDNYNIDLDSFMNIDNGNGILLTKYELEVLNRYDINPKNYPSIKELIFDIEDILEEDYDEELEDILIKLDEIHYYKDVNK